MTLLKIKYNKSTTPSTKTIVMITIRERIKLFTIVKLIFKNLSFASILFLFALMKGLNLVHNGIQSFVYMFQKTTLINLFLRFGTIQEYFFNFQI